MTDPHVRFLELAIAAIDFPLDRNDQAGLDRHLAECHTCRRQVIAIRADSRAIDELPRLALEPARVERIRRHVARGRRADPIPFRILAVAAVLTLGAAAALAAGSRLFADDGLTDLPSASFHAEATDDPGPSSSSVATVPSPSPAPTSGPSAPAPTPSADPFTVSSVRLPVVDAELHTSQAESVRLVAGGDGTLYVSIPSPAGTTLVLIDRDGFGWPLPGWPIRLDGLDLCSRLLPAGDGTVRIVCSNPDRGPANVAFAFDHQGRALPGWPVAVDGDLHLWAEHRHPRIVGGDLVMIAQGSPPDVGGNDDRTDAWIVRIDTAGSIATGIRAGFPCCSQQPDAQLGPDGNAYLVLPGGADSVPVTMVAAFDMAGERAGWPVTIQGIASAPAFDAEGRIYLAVESPGDPSTRIMVFDADGAQLRDGPDLPIVSTSRWHGVGEWPAPPLVAPDGTAFVVQSGSGITAFGVDPAGDILSGWPFQDTGDVQNLGGCTPEDTGCGYWQAAPVVGPDGTLYLLRGPAAPDAGGSLAAIGRDGRMVGAWPVELQRASSEFHLAAVGADGTVYAFVVEPEASGRSATILAIAPDSSIIYRTTVVEP